MKLRELHRTGSVLALSLLMLAGCSAKGSSAITLESPVSQAVPGQQVSIAIKTDPESMNIDASSLILSGADADVRISPAARTIEFTASETGSYEISLEQDGLCSNTIRLVIRQEDRKTAAPSEGESPDEEDGSDSTGTDKNSQQKEPDPQSGTPSGQQKEQDGSEDPSVMVTYTVDEALNSAQSILDGKKEVVIVGFLPQTLGMDSNGNLVSQFWNSDQSQYLVLSGEPISFGSCQAALTGTLSYNGTNYVLNVTQAEQLSSSGNASSVQE